MKTNYFFILLLFMAVGCKTQLDELEVDEWAPILAVPLVNSTITYDDVITELNHPEEVLILEDGLIGLNFKGELFSFTPEELVSLPEFEEQSTIDLDGASAAVLDLNSEPVVLPVSQNVDLDFGENSMVIDEVLFSSGMLNVSLTRLQDEFVSSSIVMNGILDETNSPLSLVFEGNEAVGTPEVLSIDLTNYKLTPSLLPPDQNFLTVSGTLTIENNANNTAVAGGLMDLNLEMNSLSFSHVIGDFGNIAIAADVDTILLDIFQGVQGGNLQVEEAIVNFNIENSFGIPTLVDVGEIVSQNLNSGVETPLLFENINLNGQENLASPPEFYSITYDNDNSSVNELFTSAPVNVIIDVTAEANPDGPPPPSNLNFITDSSRLDFGVDVILPLQGTLQDMVVLDTLDSDFFLENQEEIDSLELRIETNNGFPLGCALQITFLDSLNTAIDSLYMNETLILEPAITDADGNMVNSSTAENYVLIDQDRVLTLNDTRKIVLRARFNTYDSDSELNVKLNNTQDLVVKLGAKLFGRVEL